MTDLRREVMGQIRALRRRIDPKLLKKVRDAVYAAENPPQPSEKEAAREVVSNFLDGLRDGGAFRAKLDRALRDEGRDLTTLLDPTPPMPPKPEPPARPPVKKVEPKPAKRRLWRLF